MIMTLVSCSPFLVPKNQMISYSNHLFPKIFKEICNFDNCNIDIQVSGCDIETLDSCQNCTFLLNLVNTGWEAAMCKPLCGLSKNCREGSSCNEDIWSTPAFWSWGVSICCWYWSSHSNQVSHPWLKEIHKVYVTNHMIWSSCTCGLFETPELQK